jgi:nucleoside diphosphate kinase
MESIRQQPLIEDSQKPFKMISRKAAENYKIPLLPDDELAAQHVLEVLSYPELNNLIDEGFVTIGIIKPQVEEGDNLPSDADKAANIIKNEIGENHIMLDFVHTFTEEDVEKFYEGVKNRLLNDGREEIWEMIKSFSSLKPVNILLLFYPEGDAVARWRNVMGPTDPQKAREEFPDSIRGKHANTLPNNIVHGSDSMDSVKREMEIIKVSLEQRLINH